MAKWAAPVALVLASLLRAEAQIVGTNFASCTLTGRASGIGEDASVVSRAASTVAANVCGGETQNAEDVARQVATATATAIANSTAACITSGLGSFTVNGLSLGQARATAVAEAFATALATAPACDGCEAVANFTGRSFSEILINATARAEVNFDSSTSTDPTTTATQFAEDIASVVIRAFSTAISTARSSAENNCSAEILATGVTGEVGDPNPNAVFCSVISLTRDRSVANDVVAAASQEAIALAGCTPGQTGTLTDTATLLAEAFASALALVAVSCDTRGPGNLCAAGESDIQAAINATAGAFARTLANGTAVCNGNTCTLAAEVVAEAVLPVAAQAAAAAQASGCIGDNASLTAADLDLVTNTSTVTAFAEAVASAFANAEEGCVITTNTTATVVPTNPPVVSTPETRPPLPPPALVDPLPCAGECAPQGRKCAGLNFPVALPCCEEGFLCVERTPAFAQCRFQGIPGLVGWTGNIIPCGTPGP